MKNETYCWLVLLGIFIAFFQLSCESYMVMDVFVQNPQESSGYDRGTTMRKKHVSRDSKVCCCCCRFCCGAPTTDERIHAPVLHDASQIDYASLPPISSICHRPERPYSCATTCLQLPQMLQLEIVLLLELALLLVLPSVPLLF